MFTMTDQRSNPIVNITNDFYFIYLLYLTVSNKLMTNDIEYIVLILLYVIMKLRFQYGL